MYEIPIPSLKWIQDVESMRKILEGIDDPYWKEDFIKEVRRQSRRFSTHKQLLDYYTYQVNPKTDVRGYREPTPNTVKDPSTRSYPSGYNQRSGRDDGGSQAGARQDTMTAQMAGLEVNSKLHLIPYLLQIRTNVSYYGRLSNIPGPALPARWKFGQRL